MEQYPNQRHIRQSPPRNIGVFTQGVLFFGGFLVQFGWFFLGFGLLFTWIFLPASDLLSLLRSTDDWHVQTATITAVSSTNMSENDNVIYKNFYEYPYDASTFLGSSYTLGKRHEVGETASIRIHPTRPYNSVLENGRAAPFSPVVLFVLVFPLVGLGMVLFGTFVNIHNIRLLKIGTFTRGKLLSKVGTNQYVKINNTTYPVYSYTFEFEHLGKLHQATCKTHVIAPLEDEETEIILYDHLHPDRNMVYDSMPYVPKIDQHGWLKPLPITSGWVFIAPLITFFINSVGILLIL